MTTSQLKSKMEASYATAKSAGDTKAANSINWSYFCTFGKYLPE